MELLYYVFLTPLYITQPNFILTFFVINQMDQQINKLITEVVKQIGNKISSVTRYASSSLNILPLHTNEKHFL